MPQSDQTPAGSIRYRVRHLTHYEYSNVMVLAHHTLHLRPRDLSHQHVETFAAYVDPSPATFQDHTDFFGNPITFVTIAEGHRELSLRTEMTVEVVAPEPLTYAATPSWESLRDRLFLGTDRMARGAAAFVFPSTLVPPLEALRDYAAESFLPGRPIAEASVELTRRIHADFAFDPTATNVATPLAQVIQQRRGVCQDFAHLQIGCLRAMGLPARYVSGYLRTVPPPGMPRLVGADATHAWLSVWLGDQNWLDLDPTNGQPGSADFITVAWGRDYDDVAPIRGVLLGGGTQSLSVEVDVEALTPA